jgi:hypothetical protein
MRGGVEWQSSSRSDTEIAQGTTGPTRRCATQLTSTMPGCALRGAKSRATDAVRRLARLHGIRLALPKAPPSAAPRSSNDWLLIGAVIGAVALIGLSLLVIRRRWIATMRRS